MVDLHIHTTCSDGDLSPQEVVRHARTKRLRALAITDHDTIDGNGEALEAGERAGLPVIPGVEISTEWNGTTFHLLGYGIRNLVPRVTETFRFLVESRRQRNPRMAERLRDLGVDLSMDEVLAEANGALVGRPHFARVLVRKKAARSMQDAFDRFLGRGAPAYVDKERLGPAEACDVIREAGGVTVLAHPGLLERDRPGSLPELLEDLLDLGLNGIEAYYSRHRPDQVTRYLSLARRYDLLVTGGSDFHGSGEGGPEMGTGFGSLRVPDGCFEALRERLEAVPTGPVLNPGAPGCPPPGR